MTRTDAPRRRPPGDPRRPRTVPLDGDRQLAYAEYGPADGVPVVFLHGTPGSRRLGALFESSARERGIRLVAPDRPGFGRSSPRPDRAVGEAAEFLVPIFDDAGVETATLVAFSGGAPYALAAATTTARIDRVDVVAGATPPAVSDSTPAVQRLLTGLATTAPTALRGLFRGQAWLAERLDPSFVVGQYTTGDVGEPIGDATADLVRADFVEAFARHRSGAVTEFRHAAADWGVDFDAIDAAVRFWHGERDANVPIAGVRRLASKIPAARLRAFDDADHLRTLLRSVPEILSERAGEDHGN